MGSSLILKMTVEKAMKQLGVACEIEHQATGTMSGIKADLIVASRGFADELTGYDNVVLVTNVVSVDEVKNVISAYLDAHTATPSG